LHNDLVLTVWDAKVEDDQVQLEGYSDLAASGIEVDTCGRECLKINVPGNKGIQTRYRTQPKNKQENINR